MHQNIYVQVKNTVITCLYKCTLNTYFDSEETEQLKQVLLPLQQTAKSIDYVKIKDQLKHSCTLNHNQDKIMEQ